MEANLLNALLINGNLINQVDLLPEHFTSQAYQQIFDAMLTLAEKSVIDIVTVDNYLKETYKKDYMPILADLIRSSSSARNIKEYSKNIKQTYSKNRKIHVLNRGLHDDLQIDEIITELMEINKEVKSHLHTLKQSTNEALQEIDNCLNGLMGLQTGYKELDRLLGGWRNSDLYIIGARPAMGKTALMVNFARNCGGKSLIVSSEQPASQLAMRFMSQESFVCAAKLRNAELEENDWTMISNYAKNMKDGVFIYDKPSPTITEVMQQARKNFHEHGIQILFVDYVQKIRPARRSNNKAEEVAQVVEGLKHIARELDIPVIALAQVNREAQKQADKRPTMAHLKDSGTIEQEADMVAMLYRDCVYNPDANDMEAELNVEKNRHGPIGKIGLQWDKKTMRFDDIQEWQR